MQKASKFLLLYAVFYFLFLYAPIFLLPIFAFNDSAIISLPLSGITFDWFHLLWKTMFVGLRLGGTFSMLSPAIQILPEEGVSNPDSSLSTAVLPQPDGPRSEKNSPCLICIETPSRALTEPKSFVMLFISIIG